MNNRIISLVALLSFISCTAMYQTITYEQPFAKVYEVEGKSKNKLFLDANDWMVSTFNNAESVIEFSDKEEGVIIGKYLLGGRLTTGTYGSDTRIFAKIDIRVKEGKAKIEIKPNDWHYDSSGFTVFNYSKEQADADMEALASDFYDALLKEETEW